MELTGREKYLKARQLARRSGLLEFTDYYKTGSISFVVRHEIPELNQLADRVKQTRYGVRYLFRNASAGYTTFGRREL